MEKIIADIYFLLLEKGGIGIFMHTLHQLAFDVKFVRKCERVHVYVLKVKVIAIIRLAPAMYVCVCVLPLYFFRSRLKLAHLGPARCPAKVH
jgi:hypothetical protein